MFIESLLKRKPGTTVTLDGVSYFFAPSEASEEEAPHICLVEDEDHQDTFLAIPEGYRIYRPKKTAPAVKRSVDPAPAATKPVPAAKAEPTATPQQTSPIIAPTEVEGSDPGPTEIEGAAEEATPADEEAVDTATTEEAAPPAEESGAATPAVDPAVAAYAAELSNLDDEALRDQHKACYERFPASNWTRDAIINRIATFLAEQDAEATGENTGE